MEKTLGKADRDTQEEHALGPWNQTRGPPGVVWPYTCYLILLRFSHKLETTVTPSPLEGPPFLMWTIRSPQP